MSAKIIKNIVQVYIGLALIVYAVLLQNSMQTYEIRLFELLGVDWSIIPIIGRLLMAVVIYVGIALSIDINPKKSTSYLLILLGIFFVYDGVWDSMFNPNDLYLAIWPFFDFDPIFLKYLKLIASFSFLVYSIYHIKNSSKDDLSLKWVKYIYPIYALSFTIIYNAVLPGDLKFKESEHQTELTVAEINEGLQPEQEKAVQEGEQVLMFISLKCGHCFSTTKKIAAIKRKNPDLNIRLMLFSDKGVEDFLNYARAEELPYSIVKAAPFLDVTGGSVPGILFIKDGEVVHQWGGKGNTFNYAALSFIQNLN